MEISLFKALRNNIELDKRTCIAKWNWMRCEKNWQLMSYNGFLIELNIPPFFMCF
ncbi:hypothetical protein ACE6H2_016331 [Prunus campanulata]